MPVVLGLLVALTYGGADFFGGLGAKRLPTFTVMLWSQGLGLVLMVGYVVFFAPAVPSTRDLLFGLVGGACGFVGIALQYRALAIGPMRFVAPVAAIGSAVVPVGVSVLRGQSLPALAAVGVVACLAALAVLGAADSGVDLSGVDPDGPDSEARRRWWTSGPVLAVGAGLGFGLFFVFFGELSTESGLWPVAVDRLASVVLGAAVVAFLRRRSPADHRVLPRSGTGTLTVVAVCGLLDVSAHSLYVFAGHDGLTSEVAVLSALYPATTVALAVIVLREPLRAAHLVGFVLAAAGVALIAVG
jgi:drug/metabolite transporter (DMT)-like permease